MDADKAAEELKVIRRLMQRPVRYSTMSGLSGILAGCAALAGVLADRAVTGCYAADVTKAVQINMGVWAGVFLAAFAATVILTRLREIKQGMPFWSDIKRRILLTILPPFVAGAGLTLAIACRWWVGDGPNMWGLIPAVWMLFYGLALWQVGLFSPVEVRLLGVAFILAGLVAAAFLQAHPYWTLGATFGGFEIVYGIAVRIRHGG
jgi:hypothetical protein